jgi:hypothetical protein
MKPNLISHLSCLLAVTLSCVPLSSCVSSQTSKLVKEGYMTEDLEKRVLRETGVSGAAIGALTGASIGAMGGLANEGWSALIEGRPFDKERAKRDATIGAYAGGVTGGYIGYQQGRREGEQLIVAAMSRDNIDQLLRGARAYNAGLRNYNAGLRTKISAARKESDAAKRKASYGKLQREANAQLNDANDRVAQRWNAGGNQKWDQDQRSNYRETVRPLVAQRDALKEQVDTLARLRSEGTY